MATTTYDGLTNEQRTFYELTMLPRAVPPFSHLHFGQVGIHKVTDLPENKGDVIQWRLLAAFSAVTTALTDGVTPSSEDISVTATTGTVEEYGAFVRYTRKLASMGIDMIAAEASDALAEQAGDSLDQITRDVVVAGTTVQYASTATTRGTVTSAMTYSAAEALESLATLKNNKAMPVEDGFFVTLIHPFTEYDLYLDPVFQNILSYSKERGEKNAWTMGFVGDALGHRFYCTPNAKTFAGAGSGGIDVYGTMTLGKSAFGIGGLGAHMPKAVQGMRNENNTMKKVRPLRLIDQPFGSGGTSDPLEQRATIAWYTTFVTARLREPFMVRVEHATTLG